MIKLTNILKEWSEKNTGPKRWFKPYGDKYTEYEKATNKRLKEANPDGTISPNEDKEMKELLDHIESTMEDLLYEAEQETKRIGGQFRQPGYKSQVIKLMEKLIQGFDRGERF